MKMNKKKVFVVALAVCLVAILSMGTLAWFNAADEIKNDFHVATNENGTPEFSVNVYETAANGGNTEAGNVYTSVLPGDVIEKDPTVDNTGDYEQWIRVSVTMTNTKYWQDFAGSLTFTNIFSGTKTYDSVANINTSTADWLYVLDTVEPNADGSATWYLYLREKLGKDDAHVKVFEKVTIDGDFTLEEVKSFGSKFSIVVKAEALQADNTGDNAKAAFEAVGWNVGTEFVDKDN